MTILGGWRGMHQKKAGNIYFMNPTIFRFLSLMSLPSPPPLEREMLCPCQVSLLTTLGVSHLACNLSLPPLWDSFPPTPPPPPHGPLRLHSELGAATYPRGHFSEQQYEDRVPALKSLQSKRLLWEHFLQRDTITQ